jgi:hypothetical protein
MRSRNESGGAILGIETIDHPDVSHQWPVIGAALHINVKLLSGRTWFQDSGASIAQLERPAYHQAAGAAPMAAI